MSKVIDITDKLTFEENPVVRVKDIEIELNANALDLIDVMRMTQGGVSAEIVYDVLGKLFADPEDIEKLRPLKLKFRSLMKLYTECVGIIVGGDDGAGEAQTPATT